MRRRFPITLAANGRWPDAQSGGISQPFNWIKIDNRGSGSVDVAFSAKPTSGDVADTVLTVSGNKVRVFNCAGPLNPDGTRTEDWPDQVYLVSAGGTSLILEVADRPIVDMVYAT